MERLQKLLAAAGVASRRKAEELILAGRVAVDGKIVRQLGEKADPAQNVITVDGMPIRLEQHVYILLNKPKGAISAVSDPEGRPVVTDLVRDVKQTLRPVGRLDSATEGLLLLTNDGQLAYRLTHPRWGVEKFYLAEINGKLAKEELARLREGIKLDEGITAPARVQQVLRPGKPVLVEIVIHTGWYRQVRRMLEAVGHPAISLKRVQFGPIQLGNLPAGKWRRLNPTEVAALKNAVTEARQTAGPELPRTARTTLPAARQDAQTRMRHGVPFTKARTR